MLAAFAGGRRTGLLPAAKRAGDTPPLRTLRRMPTQDPLQKYARPLVGTLIAVVISTLIAALIGGALPLDYSGRAWAYTILVCYVVAGGVVVFRLTAESESQPLRPARLVKWTLSLWIWPVFLLGRRQN